MAGQSQGTQGHAALASEAVFPRTVAHKHFYQHIPGGVDAREGTVPPVLLHPGCLARSRAPSSRHTG